MSPILAEDLKKRNRQKSLELKEGISQGQSGCLVANIKCNSPKKVYLIHHDWLGTHVNVYVAKILLEEKMGYCVEIVDLPVNKGLEEMAKRGDKEAYAILEYWSLSRKYQYIQYVQNDKTIVDAGNLGVYGKQGWFILSFMTDQYPGIDVYREYRTDTAAKYLAVNSSSTLGRLIGPSRTWISFDQQIINNLKLKLYVEYTPSIDPEASIVNKIREANNKKKPALFYFWYPHYLFALIGIKDVYLPGYSDTCWTTYNQQNGLIDCDYPTEILKKLISPIAAQDDRLLYFFNRFAYDTKDQIEIMGDIVKKNMSVWDASCKWIKNNTNIVKYWIPMFEPQQNAIIIGLIVSSVTALLVIICFLFLIVMVSVLMHRKKVRQQLLRYAPKTLPITVVFTDIQNSTLLWNIFPDKMKTALEIHNLIIRVNIAKYKGYECKTQGDSFMIAFDNPAMALGFCLNVQKDLLLANWPLEMLNHSDTMEVKCEEQLIHRGPRVRMGIHTGSDCEIHLDKTTQRMDYIGNTVNKASKIESIAEGGRIYCSEEFVEAINHQVAHQLITMEKEADLMLENIVNKNIQFQPLGLEELSGLEGLHSIYWVMDMKSRRYIYLQQLELSTIHINTDFRYIDELKHYLYDPTSLDDKIKSNLMFEIFTIINNGYFDIPSSTTEFEGFLFSIVFHYVFERLKEENEYY
ncbi:hypothetical protein C9374_007091 [Naegleria lovaniensis]|uniref:Guanylate cyclase domain-containing protein n=1 Tax=Naegleria lovaniensis TaxID=51637 RepID=A0AA88GZ22_NAELO|nr:uncharacterized protein C9374_007091 [Naegleria lovaniensis]KAG2393560.1 hypothetical protein C9374_007091 [Naegleria lovaniensis]